MSAAVNGSWCGHNSDGCSLVPVVGPDIACLLTLSFMCLFFLFSDFYYFCGEFVELNLATRFIHRECLYLPSHLASSSFQVCLITETLRKPIKMHLLWNWRDSSLVMCSSALLENQNSYLGLINTFKESSSSIQYGDLCTHTDTHFFLFLFFVLVFSRTCWPVDFWEVMEECSGIVATSHMWLRNWNLDLILLI